MKVCNTSDRLKQIMKNHGLRQVDILEAAKPFCEKHKVKLGKNDLSQYVSGKVEPGQDKLLILSLALGVSETWLMGYDVPTRSRLTIGTKISKTIAHNIQYHRTEANLTQKQFADMLGIDESFVVGLENGQIPIEKEMLYNICDVLCLIPSNFLPRDDEEYTEDEEYLLSRRENIKSPALTEKIGFMPTSGHDERNGIEKNMNILRIAGRDGSFEERILTDDQLATVKAFLNLLPDASDEL